MIEAVDHTSEAQRAVIDGVSGPMTRIAKASAMWKVPA